MLRSQESLTRCPHDAAFKTDESDKSVGYPVGPPNGRFVRASFGVGCFCNLVSVCMRTTGGSTPVGSSVRAVERMDQRVQTLCATFPDHLTQLARSELFTGPSWYFLRNTLALRREHESVHSLLDDERYFDALYATLTA